MSQYQPLADYLLTLGAPTWDASFAEIEAILGRPLPNSAYQYNAWWANQSGGHSQTAGWRDAGWKTAGLDLRRKRVRFERDEGGAHVREPRRPFGAMPDSLIARAQAATGITDRKALIDAGLRALIAKSAAGDLAAMGGTMPEAAAAPRERPFA